jgi:flavin reductase (DIM6/NTAB) family NADH-FMN oxidoreductase RutF
MKPRVEGKRAYPLARVYGLLEPGPVVLVTTARDGKPDVMTMSWLTMMEFEPPLVGCVMSSRNDSFDSLVATRECAINIPTVELAAKVVQCGNASGRTLDKFAKFGLTPVPATRIAPPLVAECYANLECRIADDRMVEAYGFFVLEVVAAWLDPSRKAPRQIHHRGRGVFAVDSPRLLKLASRMK